MCEFLPIETIIAADLAEPLLETEMVATTVPRTFGIRIKPTVVLAVIERGVINLGPVMQCESARAFPVP